MFYPLHPKKTNNPFFSVVFFNFDFELPKPKNPPHLLLKLSELVFRLYKPNESPTNETFLLPQPSSNEPAGLTWDPGSPGGATGSWRSISIGAGVQGGATKRTPDHLGGGGLEMKGGIGINRKYDGRVGILLNGMLLDGFFVSMDILYVNN